jgi:hypothetical protein
MNDHIPDGRKMDTPETDELINANLDKLGLMRLAMFCQRLERERNQAIKERDEAREHLGTAAYMYASYMEEHLGGVTPGEAKMIDRWRKAAGLEEEQ